MRQLLVAAATLVAALLPAAPATPGAAPVPAPAVITSDHRDADREAPRILPEPFDRSPDQGCAVPAGTGLEACPPESRRRPVVSCVLPVGLPPGTVVVPACPRPDPFPRGRVVPVSR